MSEFAFYIRLKILKTKSFQHTIGKTQTGIVNFQGGEIPLENLTSILTPEQEAAKRQELEQRLYEVFRKYACHRQPEKPAR